MTWDVEGADPGFDPGPHWRAVGPDDVLRDRDPGRRGLGYVGDVRRGRREPARRRAESGRSGRPRRASAEAGGLWRPAHQRRCRDGGLPRPFNTALVVLDSDFGPALAAQQGLEGRALEQRLDEEALRAAVQAAVESGNEELAYVEQIKKFTSLRGDGPPRRRRADADDEAQAQADRREVRRRDRGALRRLTPARVHPAPRRSISDGLRRPWVPW